MAKTTFIATGDSFITRAIPEQGYPGFGELAALIGQHDVKFNNLEITIHNQQGYPAAVSGGTWAMAEPEILDALNRYGFNLYKATTIKKKGEILGTIKIDKANVLDIEIVASEDVTVLKKQRENTEEYKSDVKLNDLKLPLKKGEAIGTLIVRDSLGNKIDEVTVTVNQDIIKDNFFKIFFKIIKSMILGELF